MPTCLEHWLTMAPTTCYGYKRRYHDVETLKKQIIIHGKNAGVIIADNNDGPVLSLDDFIKVSPKILSRKRPRIEEHNVPVVKSKPMNVVDGTEQLIKQPMAEQPIEQPMEQAQTLVQEAEQPIAQAVVPMQEANAVPVQAPIAFSTAHLPNANGAHKPLVLNGLVIEVDPVTFMVNATQMCKAAGKRWILYYDNDKTKSYIRHIEAKVGIPTLDLIKSNRGGNHSGTMVHLLIALDLASWLSDDVRLQFNMWNAELLLTGRVELGNEMNVQQLEDVWRRINEELQAKASADVSAAQDRCQEIILQKNELELRLATIQDAQQLTKAAQEEVMAIKVREDLEAAIQFQVNTTAPRIATYKEGDNVLYLARIEETKFKYGHTKNLKQRLEAHKRPGVYPTLELVWIVKSNNGVASEDQLHAYVKKKKIIAEYGTQREVIVLKSVDDLERMLKKMNKCALPQMDADIDMKRMDVEMKKTKVEAKRLDINLEAKRLDINLEAKRMEIDFEAKRMQNDLEAKRLKMLEDKTITFEQYWQIKNLK